MTMAKGVWGKKIGMTQIFSGNDRVVPVTAIDMNDWVVTQIKTEDKDGYHALQVAQVRSRYADKEFSADWLKNRTRYFSQAREVPCEPGTEYQVGQRVSGAAILVAGGFVDVFGTSKGKGFQGVVKRHGFTGGRASHGPRFGRIPGSVSFMRSQGRVIKGKKLPGHMGVDQCAVLNLEIVKVDADANVVFVKGAVPGGSGSVVFLRLA
jgi:large subunit ribosomal protein L3